MSIVGWLLLISFSVVTAYLGSVTQNASVFQVFYVVGFVGYGLVVWSVFKRPGQRWGQLFVGCVLLRLITVNVEPSDDLYRYLWEGRIQAAGYNPYVTPPDAGVLSEFRDDNWAKINHPDYSAIYPPLAQISFRAIASIHPSLMAFKIANVLADVLTLMLLARWLALRGQSRDRLILYAVCPLTLAAFGIEGHLDSMMIALLAGAGIADEKGKQHLCGVFLGLATLAKLVPVVLLPWLFVKNRRSAGLMLVVIGLGYLPYADAGGALFNSLTRFGGQTDMLGLGFSCLSFLSNGTVARVIGIVVIAATSVYVALKRRSLDESIFTVFAAMILVMPVVQYWYLMWVLFVMPFKPRIAWIVLSASMVFYFESGRQLATFGTWRMPEWVIFAVYTPFVFAIVAEWIWRRRKREVSS